MTTSSTSPRTDGAPAHQDRAAGAPAGAHRGAGAPATDLASRLDRTVVYQIYPQSFADASGDGIGDLLGIVGRLDYLAWLGVDALWLSPCFVSPFQDAGYDVADFERVAPRYGTNEDLELLTAEAGQRGIAVLLDLVAGHTSDEHPWFRASRDDPQDERYVWSDVQAPGMQPGQGARGGYFLPNFFPCQPALNFGYARTDPAEPWRLPVDAAGPQANRQALRDVMAFWFDRGVAGFRVDMAASLVKDDPGLVETARLWTEMRDWMDREHPGRVIISEWGDPRLAVPAGFHADFFLQFGGEHDGLPLRSLWDNRSGTVSEGWGDVPCWADARGLGDTATFVAAWQEATDAIAAAGRGGMTGLPTSNHDFTRLVSGDRTAEQAAVAFALTLTWPSVPSIYYGEEIGMRFVPDAPTTEGSRLGPTYDRAGSRTPMQWGDLPAEGFGPGAPGPSRYLPEDPDPGRPTVAAQHADPDSLLHHVRELLALRHTDRRLDVGSSVEVLATGYPTVYLRGGTLAVLLNPSGEAVETTLPGAARARPVLAHGLSRAGDTVHLAPAGYAVLDLAEAALPRTTPAPAGFLWGAATAAHQIEGGNTNSNNWHMEHAPGSWVTEVSGDACDSYHRYGEDMRLLADAGLTAYRFSLEWSRIEPARGEVSRAQLDHYRRMIDTCRDLGVEPVVTLHHFTVPQWQQLEGGWYAPDVVDRFRSFTETATAILDDVDWVVTINEPNMMVNQAEARIDTEVGVNFPGPSPHASQVIAAAHHASVDVLRGEGHIRSGWSVANQVYQALPGYEAERDAWGYWREDFFLEQSRGDDFVGVQSYLRTIIGPDGPVDFPDDVERTSIGWEYYPPALGEALRHTRDVTGGVPMLVTENGMSTLDDSRRIDYTTGALAGLAAAVDDSCDVRGYLHWSLLDNYEWGSYAPTFGLVAVDRETFVRTPKPSLAWLGDLARRNTLPRER